jgi:hypothetical protein
MHQEPTKENTPTEDDSIYGHAVLACGKCFSRLLLAERINPLKYNCSPLMAAIVGAIIGHDYGARGPRGGKLTGISITSDGFVIASTTSHDSGAFIGTASNFTRNLQQLLLDANLTAEEQKLFATLYREHVSYWRIQ